MPSIVIAFLWTVMCTCFVRTITGEEDVIASPATDLASQNAQLLEACLNLCQQGMCPSSCPQAFLGPWSKRSHHKRRMFGRGGGYGTGFDDYGWFMRLLGRLN
ncbi:uncharacterized protein LOC133191353 [Saccostrea echinata]|uniref:uncharacterized protein LOC133191353 n=1 Tax=Saccostrea echinata TaxID=191078 RepID=UPI002A80F064|nr:uncharacterized protein LOC133191353 [Saccostrea echinata]